MRPRSCPLWHTATAFLLLPAAIRRNDAWSSTDHAAMQGGGGEQSSLIPVSTRSAISRENQDVPDGS